MVIGLSDISDRAYVEKLAALINIFDLVDKCAIVLVSGNGMTVMNTRCSWLCISPEFPLTCIVAHESSLSRNEI